MEDLKNSKKQALTPDDIRLVTLNLVNRKRFIYTARDIFHYILHCICIRKVKFKKFNGNREKWRRILKKHYQFEEGEEKLQDELDVVTLLKTIRRVKIMSNIIMTQTQNMFLNFQRKNLIESSSSSGDSDNNRNFDQMRLMEDKNPMMSLVIFGKMKKMLNKYSNLQINEFDRRLLRGLFLNKMRDFDEE